MPSCWLQNLALIGSVVGSYFFTSTTLVMAHVNEEILVIAICPATPQLQYTLSSVQNLYCYFNILCLSQFYFMYTLHTHVYLIYFLSAKGEEGKPGPPGMEGHRGIPVNIFFN